MKYKITTFNIRKSPDKTEKALEKLHNEGWYLVHIVSDDGYIYAIHTDQSDRVGRFGPLE